MLNHLSIRNIVLIESLDIAFGRGLCVLTGETGAGKSIMLDALGFVLGERAGQKLLRHEAAQGSVTAEFSLDPPVLDLLAEQAIEAEDCLSLRRVIYADGRNKCFVNDTPVSVNLLKQIGELLLEIHGQHEQRGLLEAGTHRAILDAYGHLAEEVAAVNGAYIRWQDGRRKLEALRAAQEQAVRDEEYLRHIAKELQKLSPEIGEEEILADKRSMLMNKGKMLTTLSSALEELTGSKNVESALLAAQRVLIRNSTLAPDGRFTPAVEALERAAAEVHEAVESIESIAQEVESEGEGVEQIEERLFALRAASRKFNKPVDALGNYLAEVENKLALLDDRSSAIEQLVFQEKEGKERYRQAAITLTQGRKAAATKLQAALLAELVPLKMGNTRFEVAIDALPETEWNASGADKVFFLASTNPGSPLAPLVKIASGGELSRFMLAIKVVLAEVNIISTMIFDEVDTGIGGAVADAVGKRLQQLAGAVQVIVVTHQPQVAAKGSFHLKVQKQVKEGKTTTAVKILSPLERKEELARMLAGEHITEEARAAADKLLEL